MTGYCYTRSLFLKEKEQVCILLFKILNVLVVLEGKGIDIYRHVLYILCVLISLGLLSNHTHYFCMQQLCFWQLLEPFSIQSVLFLVQIFGIILEFGLLVPTCHPVDVFRTSFLLIYLCVAKLVVPLAACLSLFSPPFIPLLSVLGPDHEGWTV
jgi:hypothetical protein